VVLGATAPELGGSEWAAVVHGLRGGRPPHADLDAAVALHGFVIDLVASRSVRGIHDVSDGGLACAIAEMAIAGKTGATIDLATIPTRGGCSAAEVLFAESTSRVIVSLDALDADAIVAAAASLAIPAAVVGVAGGEVIAFGAATAVSLRDASEAWRRAIPAALAH
jgi:phosphoribosylformylglycinamidine synthase